MSVAAYPASSLPKPTRYKVDAPEYAVTESPPFQDGARDANLDSEIPVRRFALEYAGLLTSEADALDAHYDSAFGTALGFDFTDPDSGTTYSDVKYEKLERSEGETTYIQVRTVQLVRYP